MHVLSASRRRFLTGLTLAPVAYALARSPAALAQAESQADLALAALDGMAAKGALSGVVVAEAGGKRLLGRTYGLANRETGETNHLDTQFNLASIGKMFTAVAVGRLADQGRIRWGDPITKHVADLPPEFREITVEHLLTHRAGLGSYFTSPLYAAEVQKRGRTVTDYMAIVRADRPAFAPGAEFLYSNNGYVLLGALIEAVTGRDYYDAVSRLVYGPAGMKRTAHLTVEELKAGVARGYTAGCFARPPSMCTPGPAVEARDSLGFRGTPAGGVYSTANDLLAFARALHAGRLVRPETLALMRRPHVEMTRPGGPQDAYGYGFGIVRVGGRELFGHNGGTPGFGAQVDMASDAGLTMIVLTNLDGGQRGSSAALRRAFAS